MRISRLSALITGIAAISLLSGCSLLKDFDFEESGPCDAGLTLCDGVCVDLDTDRLACGSCGNVCAGATSLCDDGVCAEMGAIGSSHHFLTVSNGASPVARIASAPDRGFYYGVSHAAELSLQETPAVVRPPADNLEGNFGKYASNGNLNWANGIIGDGLEYLEGVSSTPDGAVAVGFFTTTAADGGTDFTDSMGIDDPHSATNNGSSFVWAVNSDGTHKWWQDIRSSDYARASFVEVDDAGNVYIVGRFSDSLQVAGSPDLSNGITFGYFVARLRSNGARDWVSVIDVSNTTLLDAMAIDSTGAVYIFGVGSATVDVGDGPESVPSNTPTIMKVTSAGVEWWEHYDSAAPASGGAPSVAVTSDDRVFIAFNPTDPSSAIGEILLSAGGTLVEVDAGDGTPIPVVVDDTNYPILNEAAVTPYGLGVDGTDTLVLAGGVTGDEVDLGGGPITKPDAGADALIAAYTPDGDYRYGHIYGTTAADRVQGVAVHPSGRVTTAGNFNEMVTWDAVMLTPAGGTGSDTYFVAHEPEPLTPAP